MFDHLDTVNGGLRQFLDGLDVDGLSGGAAASLVEKAAEGERLCAAIRLLASRRIDAASDRARADWLAGVTGQTPFEAARDLEAADRLDGLAATERAVRDGALSAAQVREVAAGASADPTAEPELLDTARNASVHELRRKAKAVRAAASDDEAKNRRAHRNRNLNHGTDTENGEGWIHARGPAAVIAQVLAFLEPFVQAQFKAAKTEGRFESRGAYAFDALVDALRAAGSGERGAGPPVRIIARVDAVALRRGHTVAGETCDIEGVGPVPVAALLELLPRAAIDVIVTDGEEVFNVTSFSRRANVRQQVVLHWLGVECAREGCSATRRLEVDHRIDWATTHVTELKALDWLCTPDHRRKTHEGWALVHGRGRRRMVPPDDPDHPANSPPATGQAA